MFYLIKTPWIVRKWIYPSYLWRMPADEKNIYLTFDDGPHPEATPLVLDRLKEYNAKATFFCIGKNVLLYPEIFKRIIAEGHAIGNHTHNHLNGWKSSDDAYFSDTTKAATYIDSTLFRPPYGRITRFQAKQLMEKLHYKIIMWSVLSGDFDRSIDPEKCWKNVQNAIAPGTVVVFHDSEKAYQNMAYALPRVLENFTKKGFVFKKIEEKL